MSGNRDGYRTRQRELVISCLTQNTTRYLTVDEVWSMIVARGERIGRTTVYRNLEKLVSRGTVLKATAPGGESSYRVDAGGARGQLLCLSCGKAYPLDCHMVDEFTSHVYDHHGFRVDPARTVLYGVCHECMEASR